MIAIETLDKANTEMAILRTVIDGGIHNLEICGSNDDKVTLAMVEQYERVKRLVFKLTGQESAKKTADVPLELPI